MTQGKHRLALLKIKGDAWPQLGELNLSYTWNEDENIYEVAFEEPKYDPDNIRNKDPLEQLCDHYLLPSEVVVSHEETSEDKLKKWVPLLPLNKETKKTAVEEILDTYDMNSLREIAEYGASADGDNKIKNRLFFAKHESEMLDYFYNGYNGSEETALNIWGLEGNDLLNAFADVDRMLTRNKQRESKCPKRINVFY